MDIRNNSFTKRVVKELEQAAQGSGGVTILWGYLKDMQIWRLGAWFSGGLGSVRLMVGLDDLTSLFQPKGFYDSMTLWRRCPHSLHAKESPLQSSETCC